MNLRLAEPDSGMVPAATVSSIPSGQPSEVADLAAAILADAYLTNQVISLDGAHHPRSDECGFFGHSR
jgi:hypothetical protein